MIGRLTGHVTQEDDGNVVVDVNGVGYELVVPLGTIGRAKADGEGRSTLFVHTHVREDVFSLFGFATEGDRLAFRTLIGVSSVGPKTAIAVLSALPAPDLGQAIARKELSEAHQHHRHRQEDGRAAAPRAEGQGPDPRGCRAARGGRTTCCAQQPDVVFHGRSALPGARQHGLPAGRSGPRRRAAERQDRRDAPAGAPERSAGGSVEVRGDRARARARARARGGDADFTGISR